jgi:hypothetical protein
VNAGAADEWRKRAARYRERATRYREAIERAERPGGSASHVGWTETKAILLEMVGDLEREAREAEIEAARSSNG